MPRGDATPQINISKIQGGAGIPGALFAVASVLIFLIGIPALRYFLPAAVALGGGVALVLHFVRHEPAGRSWIRAARE
jgi:hypothetical protein